MTESDTAKRTALYDERSSALAWKNRKKTEMSVFSDVTTIAIADSSEFRMRATTTSGDRQEKCVAKLRFGLEPVKLCEPGRVY